VLLPVPPLPVTNKTRDSVIGYNVRVGRWHGTTVNPRSA